MDDFERVREAVKRFPEEFGLRAFPGRRFCVSEGASFVSEGEVVLYVYVKSGENWLAFAKGSESELRAEVVQ